MKLLFVVLIVYPTLLSGFRETLSIGMFQFWDIWTWAAPNPATSFGGNSSSLCLLRLWLHTRALPLSSGRGQTTKKRNRPDCPSPCVPFSVRQGEGEGEKGNHLWFCFGTERPKLPSLFSHLSKWLAAPGKLMCFFLLFNISVHLSLGRVLYYLNNGCSNAAFQLSHPSYDCQSLGW